MNRFATALVATLGGAMVGPATGATWPDHPLRLVVPFPAGGPTDIIARVVSQAMTRTLGQPIVIENRGGAGGVIGADFVARSAPDGYTFALANAGSLAILPSLQKMPYRPTEDLKPVTLVAKVPELLVVPESLPVGNLGEFLALARSKPGALNYASTGTGATPHLAAELLKSAAKIDVVHVPFSGAAPAVTELLAGRVQMMFADIPVLLPHVRAGKLRALAIGSAKRSPLLPDVPTFIEQGLPAVEADNWYGFVTAGATPDAVQSRLVAAAVAAIQDAEVSKTLAAQGVDLVGGPPEQFTAYIRSETAKWGGVVRAAGVKLE
jgi:tripartite-type tricarboxylate transporter receptor subunit TctC